MKKLLEDFLDRYLVKRDLDGSLSFVTEHVISIGTGEHETARNRAELRKLMEDEFAELPNSFEFYFCEYTETEEVPYIKNFFARLHVKLKSEEDIFEIWPRLTGTFVQSAEGWKISSLHMSVASEEQKGNTFFPVLHYGTKSGGTLTSDSEEVLMALIADTLPGGIMGGYLEKDFPLYTINDKMLDILGYTYEELLEATDEKMINVIFEDDRESVEKEIEKQFAEKGEYEILYRAVGKDGRIIWVNDTGKKIVTEDGREAMISIMTDLTEQVEREKRLAEEANRDSLTHLYNRRKVRELIEKQFEEGNGGILFICDIDHFKFINDTKGHVFGDHVLETFASILNAHAEDHAIIGRLGGDEYIVFFTENVSSETAMQIMKDIQEDFCTYMSEQIQEKKISVSAGGAVREQEGVWALYNRADKALYMAKQTRNTILMA